MATQRTQDCVAGGDGRVRVPQLAYIPAGLLSSKPSSISLDEPLLELSLRSPVSDTPSRSVDGPPDIIVFEQFTPKDCTASPQRSELPTAGQLHRWAESSAPEETESTPEVDRLRLEVETLQSSVARYEHQNQELRREIHLSTSDLLQLDRAKREACAEAAQLRATLATHEEDTRAVNELFERLYALMPAEDAHALSCESMRSRCEIIYNDYSMMLAKLSRMKIMHDHVSAENKRLSDAFLLLQQCEKRCAELQREVDRKEKAISVMEDQLAVLRSSASKATAASSGRNSSDAGKRYEPLKSNFSSMSKSPLPAHRAKGIDSFSYLDTIRTSSASSQDVHEDEKPPTEKGNSNITRDAAKGTNKTVEKSPIDTSPTMRKPANRLPLRHKK